jgi:predicted nucleic acid-binding protein
MKIFVDSGVLIEYLKGNETDFYEALIERNHSLLVNQVVISEFLFYFIALSANKSPMSIKMAKQIAESFRNKNPFEMLPGFTHLGHNQVIAESSFELMKKYNLLPNDALILASCLFYNIGNLASFDSDFEKACQDLGINLFSKVVQLV